MVEREGSAESHAREWERRREPGVMDAGKSPMQVARSVEVPDIAAATKIHKTRDEGGE